MSIGKKKQNQNHWIGETMGKSAGLNTLYPLVMTNSSPWIMVTPIGWDIIPINCAYN